MFLICVCGEGEEKDRPKRNLWPARVTESMPKKLKILNFHGCDGNKANTLQAEGIDTEKSCKCNRPKNRTLQELHPLEEEEHFPSDMKPGLA